jgi:signal transduction histidine kinase
VHGVVGSTEQVARYGAVIDGQTRRLSRLVEEVLLFAATREHRYRYELTTLGVPEIIDRALSEIADLVEASGFTVERDVPGDLPPVRGDLAALSQCLENLITNALKYSGGEKWIGIRARTEADPASVTHEVVITVEDRGIGIDSGDLTHVFEPFYRSARAIEAQIHGTGLGLSLARNIAEAMRGRLTAKSGPGPGVEFSLHLPVLPDEG